MSSEGTAVPHAAVTTTSARAQASRINGARSRGPRTAEGKARSSQNALKRGLRAQRFVVLPDEDAAEFRGLEAALIDELAPEGALQTYLARRVAAAAWRLSRADRIEAELFEHRGDGDGDLGLALIRDGNGARAFQMLLRYRGAAQAELWRALRTLKALQAEEVARPPVREAEPEPSSILVFDPARATTAPAAELMSERRDDESARSSSEPEAHRNPIEPESRRNPCEFEVERGAEGPSPGPDPARPTGRGRERA